MKINMPVTNNEVVVPEGVTITSKTDMKGIITHANPAFIEISGFSEKELVGKNHNIVRHPDMPPIAFEGLWDDMKAGKTWTGIVKNRCKNGDFYWVEANVTPIYENGHLTGYLSVRTRPSRQQIEQAEALYRKINEGKVKLNKAAVWKWLNPFGKMTLKVRMVLTIGFLSALLIVMGAVGLAGMNQSKNDIAAIYRQHLVPTGQIAFILDRIAENRAHILKALMNPKPRVVRAEAAKILANRAKISKAWESYQRTITSKPEKAFARQWAAVRARFTKKGVDATISALAAGQVGKAKQIAGQVMSPDYLLVRAGAERLMQLDLAAARASYEGAEHRYVVTRNAATIGIVLGLLLSGLTGFILIRSITERVKKIIEHCGQIAQGNYSSRINIGRYDEMGRVLDALKAMQIKLSFDVTETKRVADESLRIKNALDNTSTNIMIADNDRNVIYMNKAIVDMFKDAEADMKKIFPSFDPEKLIGNSIDSFHKNPAHQREMLKTFATTHRTTIKIGERSFNLAANPVINKAGERLGSAVEWIDITAELKVQDEINQIVTAALVGDLSKRIVAENTGGFTQRLSEGINRLLDTVSEAMNDVANVLNAMANGDLTEKITKEYQGTFRKVKDDFNTTVEKLTAVVSKIKESSDLIGTASMEIAGGNSDLSQRTEEQASSLEETASSMEELTSTVRQNADNAHQANQLANAARDLAAKGGSVVGSAISAMGEINSSSRKIADIIGVIDEIAFQTNLLALNAAVEAARAGEQGRGFAVVAAEVRNLAQRSATAAKEIKALINDSVDKVSDGSALVNESGKMLDDIVASVKKVSDIISEIAAASQEQSSGIEQVNKAVMQMDEMTQQNAALVEEAAAASRSMEEQAKGLGEMVQFFKLERHPEAAAIDIDRLEQQMPEKKPSVRVPSFSGRRKAVAAPSVAQKAAAGNGEWEEF